MLGSTSLEKLHTVRKTTNSQYGIAKEKRLEELDRLTRQKYSKLF